MENKQTEMQSVNTGLNSATGGIAYSAAAVVYIVIALIFQAILGAVEKYSAAYFYLGFIGSPIAIAISVTAVLFVRKVKFRQIFPVKCHPKYYLIGLLIVFGLFFALNQVNEIFLALLGKKPDEYTLKLAEFMRNLSGGEVVLALILVALIPAVFEETLFRGLILNAAESGAGSIRTVFLVGFCFSLFHTSPSQTVYQFIAGCLFAFVAIRSRSILPGIVMHFINNALVIILSVCGCSGADGSLVLPQEVYIALTVVGACALVGGVIWLIFDKSPLKKCAKGGVKNFFLGALVGIAVLVVLWVSSFIAV